MLGVSQSEAVGTSVYDYLSDEQQKFHKSKIKKRTAGMSESYELILTSVADKDVPCLFSATPFYDVMGKRAGSFALVSDITEYKKNQLTLEKSMQQAETASKAKSEFLSSMSHELRTPLNAIIGFSDTIKEELFGPLGDDKYREYIDDIHDSGQHLLELINDILDVSAIEAGALVLYEDNVSVPKIVAASMRLVQPRADMGQVRVTSSIDAGLPTLFVDERRVKQVLLNLLSNAVKFTLKGGEAVVSALLNDDGSLAIAVKDTGIGMDKEEIKIALGAFKQVDSGLDRKHEGTGLGLPLTMGLMELHGGTLDVKSKKGEGTEITVTFPKDRVRC